MKKRKLNGKFLSLICLVALIVISIIKIPNFITHNKLEALGYDEETIEIIKSKKLDKLFIDNSYYSDFLKEELKKDSFELKYLDVYLTRNSFDKDDIYLYERLKSLRGYSDEELVKLFKELDYVALRPLVCFDKIENLDSYIEDCLKHKDNTLDSYYFSGNYLLVYKNTVEVNNPSDIEVLVNLKRSLGAYVPEKIAPVGSTFAIPGVYLETRCLEAFNNLATKMKNEGVGIYAIDGYTSYETQVSDYDWFDMDKEAYAAGVCKPGHNEAQTGLLVRIKASETDKTGTPFVDSKAYEYLKEHAHEYGFILRYPKDKEDFTGYEEKADYIRFVGVDLALKIHESNMTFEEYYYMYMA